MTDPTETARALLWDAENYLSALHGSVARHDNLAANLGCAGCELRDRLAAALRVPAVVSAAAPSTDQAAGPVCKFDEGCHRVVPCDPGCGASADRAAADAPVKQRADCTELEWAEQERARFERLYTREFTRAEKADARAVAMERAMESTAADALKHRGCHRDLMGQCLRAERAEAEAQRLRTDRVTVLLDAAQRLYTALFPAVYDDMGQKAAEGVNRAVSELRRLAAEEQGDGPREETGAALARYIADQPMSTIQAAIRILGWPPLRFELVDADVPAVVEPAEAADTHRPTPCRAFVSGGTVWCCEEGETDCPCVCHQPAAEAQQDGAQGRG